MGFNQYSQDKLDFLKQNLPYYVDQQEILIMVNFCPYVAR
jgi:hypothetical protein